MNGNLSYLKGTQKKRGLHRLRFLRYRQTPNVSYPSKSPRRTDVSIHAFTLETFSLIWRISENKNLSGRFFMYV